MGSEVARLGHLTEKQAIFAKECSRGVPASLAATLAGYAVPEQAASLLKSNPTVQAAIQTEIRRFLQVEAAPAAIRLLYDFMVDPTRDDKLRRACANDIRSIAGYIPPKARDANALDGKSLVDMTAEEMREAASRIQRELSERAVTIIDSEPDAARNNTQAIDILE